MVCILIYTDDKVLLICLTSSQVLQTLFTQLEGAVQAAAATQDEGDQGTEIISQKSWLAVQLAYGMQ